MTDLLIWKNLTELRKIAKDKGVPYTNRKKEPELLEELAKLDVLISEEPGDIPVVGFDEPKEKDEASKDQEQETTTDSTEAAANYVEIESREAPEVVPELSLDQQEKILLDHLNYLEEEKKKTHRQINALCEARYAKQQQTKKTPSELMREQKEQEAAHRKPNTSGLDAIAIAQMKQAAAREAMARKSAAETFAKLRGK